MFAMASTEEIQNAVHEFNKVVNDQAASKNQPYILQQLSTFIYAHSTVKQLSRMNLNALIKMSVNYYITSPELQLIFRMYFNQYSWCCFHGASFPFAV